MLEDYGRWMAALILLTLLLAAVFLFATADLDMYENTLTDVRSAPVLSGADPAETDDGPTLQPLNQRMPHVGDDIYRSPSEINNLPPTL